MKTATTNLIARIAAVIAGIGLIAMTFAPAFPADAASYPIGGQQYYLSGAGVTSSATTIPLSSLKTPDGRAVTMSMIGAIGYGTIEPQTVAKVESITFTGISQNGNGTASLTGVTRGIDFVYPYAASSTLRMSHSGGATFILTNTPNFYYDQFAMPTNSNVTTWPSASTSVATKGYVDAIAFGGLLPVASTLAQGVVQIATGAQAAASTPTGSSGAFLSLASTISTSTYNFATAGNVIPVTDLSTKKIADNFISTSTLLAATSTINIGAFPAWQIGKQFQVFSTPGTTTFSVPSGITKAYVQVQAGGGAGGGANNGGSAFGGGGGGYSEEIVDLTGTSTVQVFVGSGGAGVSNGIGGAGTWSTFGTNGFYLSASGGAGGVQSNNGNGNTVPGGVGSGGDLNIQGQGGSSGSQLSGGIWGGMGGSSHLGGGGGSVTASSGNSANNGSAGGNYGGGGGGSATIGTAGVSTGGAGGQGVVIVRW